MNEGKLQDKNKVEESSKIGSRELSSNEIRGEKSCILLKANKKDIIMNRDQVQLSDRSKGSQQEIGGTCLVCFEKAGDCVFMSCGHGGLCYECSTELWDKTGECYLCRKVRILELQALTFETGN